MIKIKNKEWYRIENKLSGPTQVIIYGDIGDIGSSGITASDFVNDLQQLSGDLEIHLNTNGGVVSDGVTIYNALKRHPGNKTVIVDGYAASIGSVIAMAGDQVLMGPGSFMMIHEGQGICQGDADGMRQMADILDMHSNAIAGFYADKTGTSASKWRTQMKSETWYDPKQAIKAGLADGMSDGSSVSNFWNADNNGWVARDGKWVFDPDNDGDDDSTPEGDTDHDYFDKNGHQIKPIPPKPTQPAPSNRIGNVSKPHGDVEYADPGYLDADGEQASKSGKEGVARYPIDEEHVMAAWSYINQDKNASQYTSEQLASIKSKIKAAMAKYGHDVSEDASNSLAKKISDSLKGILF